MAATDDAIIRKRLYTHTIALRGEPPLKKVTRKYLGLGKAAVEDSPKEAEEAYVSFIKDLSQYEFQMRKAKLVADSNARDQKRCSEKEVEVSGTCQDVTGDIERLKGELEEARLERQHKEEYEALRKLCMQHPRRSATRAEIAKLEGQLAKLESEGVKAAGTLELRRKQFQLLLHTVDQLGSTLSEEAEAEEEARAAAGEGGDGADAMEEG